MELSFCWRYPTGGAFRPLVFPRVSFVEHARLAPSFSWVHISSALREPCRLGRVQAAIVSFLGTYYTCRGEKAILEKKVTLNPLRIRVRVRCIVKGCKFI